VPSDSFRSMMKRLAIHLKPYHILIHGTKGFDWVDIDLDTGFPKISRKNIRTMSEVIIEESQVIRVGCVSGPNLSKEIMAGLPAASVIASRFDEVIKLGHEALQSPLFKIYGSHDILGAELAGALKNMIAIGAGIIGGLEMGKNIEAMFITRGLREMLLLGKAMGADHKTFFGNAGIGDLIATATSNNSRNYQFGLHLAAGKTKSEIEAESEELAEGVRTVKLMFHFAQENNLNVPIVEMLYAVIYGGLDLKRAITYLLEFPYSVDVDFM
jgi:glycerol-3-phosphate dehydrogenase (NAD(P)+)